MNKVYINCLSSFLPNESVDNEHIEDFGLHRRQEITYQVYCIKA